MYDVFNFVLGLALLVSFIAIIKPSLFHKYKKDLNRKHSAILFGCLILVSVISTSIYEGSGMAEADQQLAQERAAQKAEQQAKEQEENAAILEELNKIQLSGEIKQNSIGTPEIHMSVTNGTDKTIDAFTFETYFSNNFGDPVGEWGRAVKEPYRGQSQKTIAPGQTVYTLQWNLAVYESTTKMTEPKLLRVHFTDGTELINPTILD